MRRDRVASSLLGALGIFVTTGCHRQSHQSYERGKVSLNPCLKVRIFTETPRRQYITDEE